MLRRILTFIAVLAIPLSLTAISALPASADETPPTLSPAQGPPGTSVTASASDWSGCSSMSVSGWGTTLGTATINSAGAFSLSFTVPSDAALGATQLQFSPTCTHSTYMPFVTFTVTQGTPPPTQGTPPPPPGCTYTPKVTFSPASGPVGTTFTIAGSGWEPGGTVTSTLPYGSPGWFTGYQTPTVNANGGLSYQETVGTGPGGPTPPGTYTFTYVEKYGGCSVSFHQIFTVTPKPHPTCPPAPQPRIYWSQIAGPQGARLSLTGNGWYANDTVTIHLPHDFYVSRTSWPADSSGDWQLNITVGDSIPPGSYELTFSQSACGGLHVTGDFKVTMSLRSTDWADYSFCSRYGARYTKETYHGVAACGNAENASNTSNLQGTISYQPPGGATVYFDSAGFQCVELAARYFYFQTTLIPDGRYTPGTGADFVATEHQNYSQITISGVTDTFQNSITPGNIISMWSRSDPTGEGHVGVVMGFQYTNGNISGINIMDENANGTGTSTIKVSARGAMSFDGYNRYQWTTNLPTP